MHGYRIPVFPDVDPAQLIAELATVDDHEAERIVRELGKTALPREQIEGLVHDITRRTNPKLRIRALDLLESQHQTITQEQWRRVSSCLDPTDDDEFLTRLVDVLVSAGRYAPQAPEIFEALRRFYLQVSTTPKGVADPSAYGGVLPSMSSHVVSAITSMWHGMERRGFLIDVATHPPDSASAREAVSRLDPNRPEELGILLTLARDRSNLGFWAALKRVATALNQPDSYALCNDLLQSAPPDDPSIADTISSSLDFWGKDQDQRHATLRLAEAAIVIIQQKSAATLDEGIRQEYARITLDLQQRIARGRSDDLERRSAAPR